MKSWILSHKILAIVLACVLGAGVICAVALPIALAHKHEFSTEWTTDENYHWHKCKDEKCKEVSDKAAHVFDKETVSATYFASEATYTDAAKYYKSCVCGVKGTETFSHGSSLSAKENIVELKDGVTLGKVYDGEAYALVAEDITRNGDGEVTVTYQRKGDADFGNTAPKNAGEYTVKVSVAATAEWKEAEKTFDFTIAKKPLKARATKPYDGTNTIPDVIPEDVCKDDDVKVIVFMSDKNVGSIVTSLMLEGADKDNYVIDQTNVTASITKKEISGLSLNKSYTGEKEFEASFDSSVIVAGDDIRAKITMESKNAGANLAAVSLIGDAAGNYMIKLENVSVTVTPREIKIKNLEVEYNGRSRFSLVNYQVSNDDAAKYNLIEGDNIDLSLVFNGAKANAGNTQADLLRINLGATDAQNYKKPELRDVTVTVLQRGITVMNRGFKKRKVGVGQFEGSTRFALTEEEGFVTGEKELEIGIKDSAVASYAVGGPYDMEFVEDRFLLSGEGKDNYKVVGAEGCTLTIFGKEVTLNATYVDANNNTITGIEGNFSVTIDDKGISSQTAQGDLAEYLMKGENKNKNVEVKMEVIDGSELIAVFSRVGVHTQSDLDYACNYGSFEVSGAQPSFIEFELFNKGTKYIDNNGTWIYTDTTTLNVRIIITFSDIEKIDKDNPGKDAIGANYTAVFETTVDSGDYGSVCTLDLEWTNEKITGSEVVVYNALTGSEIAFEKVNETQYSFNAIAGNTKFYVYVEGVGGDVQVLLKVTLTCALNEGTPTRLEFSAGVDEISSGELSYAAGEKKIFVISVGSGRNFGRKYTISNLPEGATVKVYRQDGTAVTLSSDNSFTLMSGISVRDYTIVVTNATDGNLTVNFSITRQQTPGGIVGA